MLSGAVLNPDSAIPRQLGSCSKLGSADGQYCSLSKKRPHCGGHGGRHLKDRHGRRTIPIVPRRPAEIRSIFENQLKRGAVRVRPHRTICLPRRDGLWLALAPPFPDDLTGRNLPEIRQSREALSRRSSTKRRLADMIESFFMR